MKPMEVVLATNNKHKVAEIKTVLDGFPLLFRTLSEFPNIGEIVEDAADFKGNALIKAVKVSQETGLPALADDSGLEVDALNGAPGVMSARFSGGDDSDNNRLLLANLEGVQEPLRTARFRCVIAFVVPGNEPIFAEGSVEGHIAHRPSGANGFGYDPLFIPLGFSRSFATLSSDEKNKISHRGRALDNLKNKLMSQ